MISGEMHYPRVAPGEWRARLRMARAMGLDAVSTYVFWNVHEPQPGRYDFSGPYDVARYVRLAAEEGLDVVLRPGPYVCAEWECGGLPAWLLRDDPPVALRTTDERYMEPVRRWLHRLGEELAPLQRARGGPIVAVQLENEYGAFGHDRAYLQAMLAALDDAGFASSPKYTIDQPKDVERGRLPGIPAAATFAPGNPERDLAGLDTCGEYWVGWFDHWGQPHERRDPAQQIADVEWMRANGKSLNFYMFCGGTNFGFANGANYDEERGYEPVTTSYDYLAALDEAGKPTPKYFAFRQALARYSNVAPPDVPAAPRTIGVPGFELNESASLESALGVPRISERPLPMESLEQATGFVLYRSVLPDAGEGMLEIEELRDYAVVRVDGEAAGTLDRRLRQSRLSVRSPRAGARLDILVENCGRINYGPAVGDRKGITHAVRWNGRDLASWEVFSLPLDEVPSLRFGDAPEPAPAFRRGRFDLAETAATYLDTSRLGKGVLFVNGHNAGRYWSIGPQASLYVPAEYLRQGSNEAVIFEVTGAAELFIRGTNEPIIES